jgi:DNA repair protein RadD
VQEEVMSFVLRPYQQAATDAGVAYLTDWNLRDRNGIIVAPTGSGKSLLVASIATALPGPSVVFQPTKEILEQNAAKLTAYGYPPALWSASVGRRERGTVTLATIGSVIRHAEAFGDVEFVLVDECHLVNAKGGMYHDFLRVLEHARCLGLTATPYRLASNSWGSTLRFLTRTRPRIFSDVVHVTQISDLSRDGFLAPLEYQVRPVIKREKLRYNSTGADYTDESVQLAFIESGFAGHLQQEVEGLLAAGRKNVLVFTRFVAEGEHLAASLPSAAVVTADTPAGERRRILDDFKAGRIKVVTNVGIVAIGFDFPELEAVVLARPTVSLSVYYQQVGRALRPAPGKDKAVIVDMVGLVEQFGRVEDLHLEAGGRRGDLWVVKSTPGGRDLTNVYFGDPAQNRKRQQQAQRFGGGHRYGRQAARHQADGFGF